MIFCVRDFSSILLKNAKENDDLDEAEGTLKVCIELAVKTYKPPWMRPVDSNEESCSIEPLVFS